MEALLGNIVGKPRDYVVCSKCRHINWYENEWCCDCKEKLKEHPTYSFDDWMLDEYEYWADEGYTELAADELELSI